MSNVESSQPLIFPSQQFSHSVLCLALLGIFVHPGTLVTPGKLSDLLRASKKGKHLGKNLGKLGRSKYSRL